MHLCKSLFNINPVHLCFMLIISSVGYKTRNLTEQVYLDFLWCISKLDKTNFYFDLYLQFCGKHISNKETICFVCLNLNLKTLQEFKP